MAKHTGRAGYPYAGTPLQQYLSKQIDIQQGLGKNQRMIALECGYDQPNIVNMMKQGSAKLPLDKVPALAKALKVDPAFLFRLAMQQYWATTLEEINSIFGTVLDEGEVEVIKAIREVTKGETPSITGDMKRQIKAIFRS